MNVANTSIMFTSAFQAKRETTLVKDMDFEQEDVLPVREELKKREGSRGSFTGVFARFGTHNEGYGTIQTVVFMTIRDANGQLVSDHNWFRYTDGFRKIGLSRGDVLQFDARVKEYRKNYEGGPEAVDYKLSNPTKIKKVGKVILPPIRRGEGNP